MLYQAGLLKFSQTGSWVRIRGEGRFHLIKLWRISLDDNFLISQPKIHLQPVGNLFSPLFGLCQKIFMQCLELQFHFVDKITSWKSLQRIFEENISQFTSKQTTGPWMSSAHFINDICKAGFSPFVTVKAKRCDEPDPHRVVLPTPLWLEGREILVKQEHSVIVLVSHNQSF